MSTRYLLFLTAGAIAIASFLIHPFGPVKAVKSAQPLLAGADVDPKVAAILSRSCQNCHSDKTEWPWYSYVAPVSWLIESDVSQARSRMNLSRWNEYPAERRQEILATLAAVVRNRQMPPPRYSLVHPGTKLSTEEVGEIYQWSRAERHRLKSRL